MNLELATRCDASPVEDLQRAADLCRHVDVIVEGQLQRAAKLDGMMIQITQKAGVDGKLFGSVTNIDIAEALAKQGFEVAKSSIRMPEGPLKTVGDHPLKVALHADVVVTVTVSVLGEQA